MCVHACVYMCMCGEVHRHHDSMRSEDNLGCCSFVFTLFEAGYLVFLITTHTRLVTATFWGPSYFTEVCWGRRCTIPHLTILGF